MTDSAKGSKLIFGALAAICFAGLVGLLFMAGVGKAQSEQPSTMPATVEISTLKWQQSFDKIQRVVGRIEATQRANVGFELAGLVADVYVDDGAAVKQGEVIAKLDTVLLKSQFDQAKASVERAQAQAGLARSLLDRVANLVKVKVESQQQLDEAKQSLKASEATVREAQANLQIVQVKINKSELVAPFNAEILTRFIDAGTVITQGQPVFEMIATGTQDVRMPMPAKLIRNLIVGQSYVLKDNEQSYPAKLKSIGKQRRLNTRTVDAVFTLYDFEGLDYGLLPGDLLALDVKISVDESGAWIPVTALSHGVRGLWNIYSVEKNQAQTKQVTARSVEVLYSDGQYAFIRGAIAPAMDIVISGTHRLAPGQQVAVKRVSDINFAGRD